jgi:hypothetical protein
VGLQKWLDATGGLSCKVGDGASLSRCHIHHICNSSPTKRAIAHAYDADRSSLNCSGERQLFCLASTDVDLKFEWTNDKADAATKDFFDSSKTKCVLLVYFCIFLSSLRWLDSHRVRHTLTR